jgi:hypothetical protein
MSTPCVTHHHACDCREQQVAVLIKAASDAAFELDEVKLLADISEEERVRLMGIAERVYAGCEVLQAGDLSGEEETHS